MRAAMLVAALAIVTMTVIIVRAIAGATFSADGAALLALPWGRVSLLDLYVGFGLFSGWVFFREASRARAAAYVVLVLALGNAFAALYVLLALVRSRGSWARFWLGDRAEALR